MSETGKHAAGSDTARSEAARSQRFQQMALPHLDAAYNLARWLCGNPNDADDVVQEAFMRAFRFFDTFHGETARPWLLAIVRRTWYTEWRKRAGARASVEFDENLDEATFEGWSDTASPDPETLMIRDENMRLVHAALEELPVEFREVLILRELEELSYREIAEIADLPVGTVMSRLARGRRKLAATLTTLQAKGCGRAPDNAKSGAAQRGAGSRITGNPAREGAASKFGGGGQRESGQQKGGQQEGGPAANAPAPDNPAAGLPRKTDSGWMPHAPGAVPGGLGQEAPNGL